VRRAVVVDPRHRLAREGVGGPRIEELALHADDHGRLAGTIADACGVAGGIGMSWGRQPGPRGGADAPSRTTTTMERRAPITPSPGRCRSSHHHVRLDVAVVQPGPAAVLLPAHGEALGRADRPRVLARAVGAPPAVAVDVERVELVAQVQDVPLDGLAEACAEDRRVADECAPVDRLEAVQRAQEDDEFVVGPAFPAPGDRQRAIEPPSIDASIDGE